jgi:hypothetical protein
MRANKKIEMTPFIASRKISTGSRWPPARVSQVPGCSQPAGALTISKRLCKSCVRWVETGENYGRLRRQIEQAFMTATR